jgi:uncharacterized protein
MDRDRLSDDTLRGRLELLVLQPTPFCNIACDYCYLPDRGDRGRMSLATLEATIRSVFESGLAAPELSIVWHAGEPMVLPVSYYEEAFRTVAALTPAGVRVQHHFQTNATLISDAWIDFIERFNVRLGVSVDGPAWLHDAHRRTRAGRGTHRAVMKGIDALRQHDVPFHTITVLTAESLHHPDTLFDFFWEISPEMACFNVEEIEGINATSSLAVGGVEALMRAFFRRIIDRLKATPPRFRVREIDGVLNALRDPMFGSYGSNGQNDAFRILSVACDGSVSTYSPELLGLSSPRYGSFRFGTVAGDGIIETVRASPQFVQVAEDVAAGVEQCRATCRYFAFCRGGAPANKVFETGTFASTETMYCRLAQKAVVDAVLMALEADLALPEPARWATPDMP